ncbi:MAG: acyl-CoA/acyl-ACP dehydrogenase [Opitutae bacterium]|nr:acyl-CoA/acyl-ACP dehydrogenase [Opitutae bacterium]
MNFLRRDRDTLEKFLPSFDAKLAKIPLLELERSSIMNPGLSMFRELDGPALLIARELGGKGASPMDAIQIHRAVGARTPSLAIAMTMHHLSVTTLMEYGDCTTKLLQLITGGQLLVASGFAEGRSGAGILAPTMQAEPRNGGYVINGSKKPCSLSSSMHLLAASVFVAGRTRAIAVVPSDAEGISLKPFWKNTVLAGAESDEVVLANVQISEQQLFFHDTAAGMDAAEAGGFLWFQVLIAASYLGVASALVERVIAGGHGDACGRTQLALEVEGAMSSLEGVARAMQAGDRSEALRAQAFFVRFSVQQAIARASVLAMELLGGTAFLESPDVTYLLAASQALALHPPSRLSAAPALDDYLAGKPMQLV